MDQLLDADSHNHLFAFLFDYLQNGCKKYAKDGKKNLQKFQKSFAFDQRIVDVDVGVYVKRRQPHFDHCAFNVYNSQLVCASGVGNCYRQNNQKTYARCTSGKRKGFFHF